MPMLELALVMALAEGETDNKTAKEQDCLIKSVIYEAAGEPTRGIQAVVEVKLNRVASPQYPNTLCGVIHQKHQFSWTARTNLRQYTAAERLRVAQVVLSYLYSEHPQRILPEGTLHYINPQTATDLSWYDRQAVVATIGHHQFIKMR